MKRLHSLDPEEVSMVPKGANKKKFLIYKHLKGQTMPEIRTEVQRLIDGVDPKAMAAVDKIAKTAKTKKRVSKLSEVGSDLLPKPDSHVYKEPGEKLHEGEGPGLSERAQAAMKAIARIAAPHKDELSKDHIMEALHAVGVGSDGEDHVGDHEAGAMHPADKAKDMEKDHMGAVPEKVSEEHSAEALAMAHKAYKAHMEKLGYRKYPDAVMTMKAHGEPDADDEGEDDVDKSAVAKGDKLDLSAFSKEQQAALQPIFKSHADLQKENVELRKILKSETDLRKDKEIEARAAQYKNLDQAKTVKIMKALEADPKALEEFEVVCKTMNERLGATDKFGQQHLLRELGTSHSGTSSAADAMAKLDALIDSVVMKSDGTRTREQIADEVYKTKEGKKLLEQYERSRGGI